MNSKMQKNEKFKDKDFQNWKKRLPDSLQINNNTPEKYLRLMTTVNPLIIPRNHKVEETLFEANKGNLEPFNQFLEVLNKPYNEQKNLSNYQNPLNSNEKYETFCGT